MCHRSWRGLRVTTHPPMQQPLLVVVMQGMRSVHVNADQYLFDVLRREAVDCGPSSPALGVLAHLRPMIAVWANKYLVGIVPSGSFAKRPATIGRLLRFSRSARNLVDS